MVLFGYMLGFIAVICTTIAIATIIFLTRNKGYKSYKAKISYIEATLPHFIILVFCSLFNAKLASTHFGTKGINIPLVIFSSIFSGYFISKEKKDWQKSDKNKLLTCKVIISMYSFLIVLFLTIIILVGTRYMNLIYTSRIGEYNQTLYFGNGLEKYLGNYICKPQSKMNQGERKPSCFKLLILQGDKFINAWVIAQSQKTIVLSASENSKPYFVLGKNPYRLTSIIT